MQTQLHAERCSVSFEIYTSSLSGNRSWALIFQCLIFILLGTYPVYCTGRLPRVNIEVGGVNAVARACVHATYINALPMASYAHTFHIAHTIADGGCDRVYYGTESFKGKEILDNLSLKVRRN